MDYLFCLQNLREGCLSFLNPILFVISEAGTILGLMIPFVIFWSFDKKLGKKLLVSYGIAQAFTNFIKLVACVNRPWIRDSRLHVYEKARSSATGYSFPSGHSTGAGVCYGGIAIEKRKSIAVCIIFAFFALAIPFARNWLGAHSFVDVITGLSIGVLSFVIVSQFIDKIEADMKSEIIFIAVSAVVLICAVIFINLKSYPVVENVDPKKMQIDFYRMSGAFFGIITGIFVEKHFVCYEIPFEKSKRWIIGLAGFFSLLLMYYVVVPFILKPLPVEIGKFLKYFLSTIYGIVVFPLLAKRFLIFKK